MTPSDFLASVDDGLTGPVPTTLFVKDNLVLVFPEDKLITDLILNLIKEIPENAENIAIDYMDSDGNIVVTILLFSLMISN